MATIIHKTARGFVVTAALAATLMLTGCGAFGGAEATPLPTRTPLPTFTPTPEGVAQAPAAPAEQQPAATPAPADQGQQPAQPPAAEQPAQGQVTTNTETTTTGTTTQTTQTTTQTTTVPAAAPTNTPAPAVPEVVTNDVVNIRQGPGTNYNLVGSAQTGTKFRVTGKNQSGDWWQIDYNGQPGWVFGQLVTATGADAVAVAQNIPAPPPTAVPAPPTNTPAPVAAAPTPAPADQPTAAPAPSNKYKFNIAVVGRCDRQPAGNWFEGKTYVNGVPQSGYKVVFSYAPDGPWITEPMLTGPHPGYPGWDQGYYSHIISASSPKAGTWYVWVVDDAGQRISEIANWTSTGPGEACNQAVVDFDSR